MLLCASALTTPLASADTAGKPGIATISADKPRPVYDRRISTQFAEHLDTGIYGGLWVGKDRSIPHTDGFRNDVVTALRNLGVPVTCHMFEMYKPWQDATVLPIRIDGLAAAASGRVLTAATMNAHRRARSRAARLQRRRSVP